MVTKREGKGWSYDFRLLGRRHRKARFRTNAEAKAAETLKRNELLSGKRLMLFKEAYEKYMAATKLAITTRESYEKFWQDNIRRHVAHLYVEEVRTDALDQIKQGLPGHLGPVSVNQRMILMRAILRFAVKRDWLTSAPHIPMEDIPRREPKWYSLEERDAFLLGVFELQPQWYLFFYLTMRLGLRRGEMYAIEHRHFQPERGVLVVDQTFERGTKDRPAELHDTRKGNDTMTLHVTPDVFDAYAWHCARGFAGKRFVFAPTDAIPKFLDSHVKPMQTVQKARKIRPLSHHKIGRHSVGSQAIAAGAHMRAVQQQLGHKSMASTQRYAHARKDAQRGIVESLQPAKAPHELN